MLSAKVKGKVCETTVRPVMTYGLETAALRKKQKTELETTELKMLRFSMGVSRMDKIRNQYVWGTAHVRRLNDKMKTKMVWSCEKGRKLHWTKDAGYGFTRQGSKRKTKEKICGCC